MSLSAPTPPAPAWYKLPNAPAPGTLLGRADALHDGQALMQTVYGTDDLAQSKPFGVLLLRSGDKVSAFANRCAHFGVPLSAKQEQLKFVPHTSISCNVHYARYRWSDGVCDRGDCEGESLVAIPIEIDAQGCIRIA